MWFRAEDNACQHTDREVDGRASRHVRHAEFERAVAELPEVVQAERLFGDPDYLLRVVTEDLAAYQQFYDDHLATLEGVQRVSSTIVMKHIVDP